LVVEYKGEQLNEQLSERLKKAVGELWAKTSGGNCIFLWARKRDDDGRDVRQQLARCLGS